MSLRQNRSRLDEVERATGLQRPHFGGSAVHASNDLDRHARMAEDDHSTETKLPPTIDSNGIR